MLRPFDVIEGAAVAGHPGLYVIGSYDSRITLYSQQVRALELVHALHAQRYLRDDARYAIIGGGAAGATLAAALAVTTGAQISLFERADELLPLQRGSTRRNLDPHLYDWPVYDAAYAFADLPILDWRAGSAQAVRRSVMQAFGIIRDAVDPRIQVLTRHDVRGVRSIDATFEIEFERDATGPEQAREGRRVVRNLRVNAVFFAFGFGLEPERPAPGVPTESYWSDAGVPGEDLAGRAAPRVLVSGNGDGGLIDLVAAATSDFDHAGMIRTITGQPGIDEVYEAVRQIDSRARAEDAAGNRFDFVTAYDGVILQMLVRLGLVEAVRARLRPGIQFVLQTLHPEMMSVKTATLNRVAVYLVMKACELDDRAGFRHVHSANAAPVAAPAGHEGQAPYWFNCGGEVIGVDKAIFRRGPDREASRAPFQNLLGDFAAQHNRWLAHHGEGIVTPQLSDGARERFARAAQQHAIPLPRHAQEAMAERQPAGVQIQPAGARRRWSGDLGPDRVAEAWRVNGNGINIYCVATPHQLGPAAMAVARIVMHSDQAVLMGNVAAWRPYIERVSSHSQHAEDLLAPAVRPLGEEGAIRNPREIEPDELYETLQQALDAWILTAMNEHFEGFFAAERDPGNRIGLRLSPELRHLMVTIWADWRRRFEADPSLLGRFLRLTLCARDDPESAPEASALVGPKKLKAIVRSTAVALAIAVGWQVMGPHGQPPGNLSQQPAAGQPRTGHACAADRIDGETMAVSAAKFMWKTNFIVLPLVEASIRVAALSTDSLRRMDDDQPRFSEADDRSSIMITVDPEFQAAVRQGPNALAALLAQVQDAHYRRLNRAIERAS